MSGTLNVTWCGPAPRAAMKRCKKPFAGPSGTITSIAPRPAARRERLDRVDAAQRVPDLLGEHAPPLFDLGLGRVHEAAVVGELERRLEQHLRDRLRAVDAPLEVVLAAEPEAGVDEAAL